MEFISEPELAARCALNGFSYATEHFSFDKMMEAKLRADFDVVPKKARRGPGSIDSRGVTPSQRN